MANLISQENLGQIINLLTENYKLIENDEEYLLVKSEILNFFNVILETNAFNPQRNLIYSLLAHPFQEICHEFCDFSVSKSEKGILTYRNSLLEFVFFFLWNDHISVLNLFLGRNLNDLKEKTSI